MAMLYAVVAIALRDWTWLEKEASYLHPGTWALPPLFGVLLAVSFELWAIHAVERWEYDGMPLIPFLHVGLAPVLQMTVIPVAVIWICGAFSKRNRTTT